MGGNWNLRDRRQRRQKYKSELAAKLQSMCAKELGRPEDDDFFFWNGRSYETPEDTILRLYEALATANPEWTDEEIVKALVML